PAPPRYGGLLPLTYLLVSTCWRHPQRMAHAPLVSFAWGCYSYFLLGPAKTLWRQSPGAFAPARAFVTRSALRVARHEVVIADFGDLEPLISVVRERGQRFVNLLEVRVGGRDFGVQLLCRLETGLHDLRRERMQLGAGRKQAPQRLWIGLVILRHHPVVGVVPGLLE